eukprot:NODE_3018_length_715_cov_416.842342_g1816_i1.p3 GENE.NODE_3018_length_715_cov_416.842342_g1816_i1~~NODE_3018_length_715_cov_416.842342_g1816_i1.p3  ORF type:complete len:79 (+),score=9.23 NODE_3018_length_715_cov_416.842342_g1816_i1:316-552(+)
MCQLYKLADVSLDNMESVHPDEEEFVRHLRGVVVHRVAPLELPLAFVLKRVEDGEHDLGLAHLLVAVLAGQFGVLEAT